MKQNSFSQTPKFLKKKEHKKYFKNYKSFYHSFETPKRSNHFDNSALNQLYMNSIDDAIRHSNVTQTTGCSNQSSREKNDDEIRKSLVDMMHNKSIFEVNIHIFLKIWEYSYYFLLILAVINFCHLSFLEYTENFLVCLYMLLGILVDCFLIFGGFLGIYYIKVEKTQKISNTYLNIVIGVLFSLTLSNYIYVKYILDSQLERYLIQQTLFFYIYLIMLFDEGLILILNFKINKFYLEYNFLLPLKMPLLISEKDYRILI